MIRLETLVELKFLDSSFSGSNFSIRVVRAYPFIEIRLTVPCRAIRGKSIDSSQQYLSQQYPPPLLILAHTRVVRSTWYTEHHHNNDNNNDDNNDNNDNTNNNKHMIILTLMIVMIIMNIVIPACVYMCIYIERETCSTARLGAIAACRAGA